MDCRLILDGPASGAWNMAMDEALLQSAAGARVPCTLRFYFWQEPTLSLGYFQSYQQRREHRASQRCPAVRRTTGGGAIVHDRELTYGFVTGLAQQTRLHARTWYEVFHAALVDELAARGIAASLWQGSREPASKAAPFLCFARRTPGDVVLEHSKIAGSAQRRPRKTLLQQGSVLLKRSQCAPQLLGIEDLAGTALDPTELAVRWSQRVASKLGLSLTSGQPTDAERQLATRLCEEKFADPRWTRRR